jgi:molecular chaperone DnaK (HSP70)
MEQAHIELPFLTQLKDGSRPTLKTTLTRAKLQELVAPLVQRTLALCAACMGEAGIQKVQIDEVLLVGGQSRMPAVRDAVTEFFGRKPRRDINPDEVVAMGAALYAYSLVADDLGREARGDAEEQYAVAVKQTAIIEKMLSDVHTQIKRRAPEDDGLRARLQSLLAETQSFESLAPTLSKKPDDHDLPVALERMQERLDEMGSIAQDVIDQLAEEISAEVEETGASPLAAEAARLTAELSEGLDFAREATSLAQESLAEADLHAQARKVELIDVTSHSLGIATAADLFGVLIDHNTPVPCEQQRLFTTNQDDQQEVEIRVLQGRDRKASENQFLGSFVLEGIAPARRMVPKIAVTFRIDENGILSVTACDGDTGAAQSMRVEDPLGLQQVKPPEPETMTIEGNSTSDRR